MKQYIYSLAHCYPHQSEVLKDEVDESKTRARRYKHIARYQRDA
jgi:hypothetical protein